MRANIFLLLSQVMNDKKHFIETMLLRKAILAKRVLVLLSFFSFFALACGPEFLLPEAFAGKKDPFSGLWISKQYTNGREFILKLKQDQNSLLGWEGHLPKSPQALEPDLEGSIKGSIAEVEVKHRRGYQARARLSLRKDKLVWQLLDSDQRSDRYFPLASTLLKRNENAAETGADEDGKAPEAKAKSKSKPKPKDEGQLEINKRTKAVSQNPELQILLDILAQAQILESGVIGEAAEPSTLFSAYKALLKKGISVDDPGLQALLKGKSAAAKVYAAAIIWELDHARGLAAFEFLRADSSPLRYRSGCEVFDDTVSGVAGSFVDKGYYLDFPSKRY